MKPVFEGHPRRAISCATQRFHPQPLRWPRLIHTFSDGGEAYEFRPMDRPEIDDVCDLFCRHYPQLLGTSRQGLLDRAFYEQSVAMLSSWAADATEKLHLVAVIAPRAGGAPIFATIYDKERYDRVIVCGAAIMTPEARGRSLSKHYGRYTSDLLDRSGADFAHATADAKDTFVQEMAMHIGFQVGGIMPGAFRWACDERTYYRDAVVYIYKFLGDAQRYATEPADWRISPKSIAQIEALLQQVKESNGRLPE